ncbi:SprT-like family protein [Vibrio phage vB_VmeM-32]|nr:SprT-like family protein [Vibrio phage vB_VmeM-32]
MKNFELRIQAVKLINNEVIRLIDCWNNHPNTKTKVSYPEVRYTCKGNDAGKASKYYVDFNLDTATIKGNWDRFQNTVSHEIAHYIDFNIRGKSGHDSFWKKLHRFLGGDGSRTHSMKSLSKLKEYVYDVNGHKVTLTSIRHKKIQEKGEVYRCSGGRIDASCDFEIKNESIEFETKLKLWN